MTTATYTVSFIFSLLLASLYGLMYITSSKSARTATNFSENDCGFRGKASADPTVFSILRDKSTQEYHEAKIERLRFLPTVISRNKRVYRLRVLPRPSSALINITAVSNPWHLDKFHQHNALPVCLM